MIDDLVPKGLGGRVLKSRSSYLCHPGVCLDIYLLETEPGGSFSVRGGDEIDTLFFASNL